MVKASKHSVIHAHLDFSRCKATGETSATVLSPANLFRLLICFKIHWDMSRQNFQTFIIGLLGTGMIDQIYLCGGRSRVKLLQWNGAILL